MKFKNDRGSALVLAILALALLTIFFMTVSFQINNQIKINSNSYADMKHKYMAEAGIEKAIYDIEKDIKSKVDYKVDGKASMIVRNKYKNHENCPKVEFKDGLPVIGHWAYGKNDFSSLIYKDIINDKSNVIYNATLEGLLVPILGPEHYLTKDAFLRTYYENEIRNFVEKVNQDGNQYYKHNQFENTLDRFISMLDDAIRDVKNASGNNEMVLDKLNEMKELMIEIKCRLGINIDEDNTNPEPGSIVINIPQYTVSLNNEKLSFQGNNTLAQITVQRDKEGELQTIDLTNLNNKTNSNTNKLIATSENKRIEAKVEFIFTKNANDYDISYKINSYEQKQN